VHEVENLILIRMKVVSEARCQAQVHVISQRYADGSLCVYDVRTMAPSKLACCSLPVGFAAKWEQAMPGVRFALLLIP